MSKHLHQSRLALTNVLAEGGYTASVKLGSEAAKVNLIIDTGSSTLVVHHNRYQPDKDVDLRPTTLAQEVCYGLGGWLGAVIHTKVTTPYLHLHDTPLALVHREAEHTFMNADGIWGLAYHKLNPSYDMGRYLQAHNVTPLTTYPWPFPDSDHPLCHQDFVDFKAILYTAPEQDVPTCFELMEQHGLCANHFAFISRRSSIHYAHAEVEPHDIAADPLNQGWLILGGGEEHSQCYQGNFVDLKVVHDRYYNVNLLGVAVAGMPMIHAPTVQEAHLNRGSSNAIIDTGASALSLPESVFTPLIEQLISQVANAPSLLDPFTQGGIESAHKALQTGVDMAQLNLADWPDIEFYFEGASEVESEVADEPRIDNTQRAVLRCPPSTYWQINTPAYGKACFKLMGQLPQWPAQSILGLPLLNPYYVVFRRDEGDTGIVRFATVVDEVSAQ